MPLNDSIAETVLKVKNISKRFFGVRALENVSFDLRKGEVLGLIGENGAGKSTMIKILAGVLNFDEGEIQLDGNIFNPKDPSDSRSQGVTVIHQERQLVPDLPVYANIFLGRFPTKKILGFNFIDRKVLIKKTRELLDSLGVDINPKKNISELSAAEKQIIDIAKSIGTDSKIVIMDEPTASLEPKEVENLFEFIKRLQKRGTSIIFVSHRIEEVMEICDRITCLRDGKVVGCEDIKNTNPKKIVKMIVGREIESLYPKEEVDLGAKVLDVQGIQMKKESKPVSFNLRSNEILACTGLLGSGANEILEILSGKKKEDGKVNYQGQRVETTSPLNTISKGIGYIPEDRKSEGIIPELTIEQNIILPNLSQVTRFGFISRKKVKSMVEPLMKALKVRAPNAKTKVKFLSGGNQQKVVIAKWLASDSSLLLFNQPTHGIDIGAKVEVHKLMGKFVSEGGSVIFASSDLSDVLSISDRTLVFYKGTIVAELNPELSSQELVMQYASGAKEEREIS